jgi:MOSC domain-containing protein YiiM
VRYRGQLVSTAIFKEPVKGPVRVGLLGLEGDGQADLRVHGGVEKAVYAYPAEHYEAWSRELGRELMPGTFGENLTVTGLTEGVVRAGDRYRAGTAVLEVTQPRFPCFKLGIRMNDMLFLKRFLESGRSGFYLRVVEEGVVAAGDAFELVASDRRRPTIAEIVMELE